MTLKQTAIIFFTIALLGTLGLLWLAPTGIKQAPDVTLTTLEGNKVNVSELSGRPVLINFWASSCRSCINEMPHLIDLYNDFAPQGLEIIGIAMAYDPPSHVISLSEDQQIPYPIALDMDSTASRAFGDVDLTPTTFLIAPDGRVVHRQTGVLDIGAIKILVMNMLSTIELSENQYRVN